MGYGTPASGTIYFDDFSAFKRKGNVLIEDGAIIAGKIATGAITATGGEIANLTVSTLKIQDYAVTVPVSAYTAGNITVTTSWTTIQSATIIAVGQPISINVSFVTTTGDPYQVRVLRDATVIYAVHNWIAYDSVGLLTIFCANIVDTPSAGSRTYYLQSIRSTDPTYEVAYNRSITLLETKK